MVRELQLIAVGTATTGRRTGCTPRGPHPARGRAGSQRPPRPGPRRAGRGTEVADLVVDLRPSAVAASQVAPAAGRRRSTRPAGAAALLTAPCTTEARHLLEWIVDEIESQLVVRATRRGPSRPRHAPERPLRHRRPVARRLPVGRSATRWCRRRPSTPWPRPACRFANHWANIAPCGPSRTTLHTGMYAQNHRSVLNGTPLDARFTNVALEARAAGYGPEAVRLHRHQRRPPHGLLDDDPRLLHLRGRAAGLRRRS